MRVRIQFGLLAIVFTATGFTLAAPGKKEKEEPPGPITAEQLKQSQDNLKQIAIAFHNYEAANSNFPNNTQDAKGKSLLSWRVHILPYIEEMDLYKQFKLDEPWDSDNNKKLIDKMPTLYAPVRGKKDAGMTFYQSFVGKNAVLKPGKNTIFANILDGTSNTFLAAEGAKPVVWSKPDDLKYDGQNVPSLGGLFDGKFHAVYCDGHVMRFKKGIDKDLLSKLIDPADGQVFDANDAIDTDKDKD